MEPELYRKGQVWQSPWGYKYEILKSIKNCIRIYSLRNDIEFEIDPSNADKYLYDLLEDV